MLLQQHFSAFLKLWLLLMPIVSTLIGILFLHESMTFEKGIGVAIVLLGAVVILLREKLHSRKEAADGRR